MFLVKYIVIQINGLGYRSTSSVTKRGTHSDNNASIHLCAVANSTALSVYS